MPAPVGALLLTGGASRRMGTPKAALPAVANGIDGATIGQRTAALLGRVAAPVLEVGPGWTTLPAVADDGEGPLAAIAYGWAAMAARGERRPLPGALVVACDLPRLSEDFLRVLIAEMGPEAVIPEVDRRLQPLCAWYPAEALDAAAGVVASGGRALRELLTVIPYRSLLASAWAEALADVDTPADFQRLADA